MLVETACSTFAALSDPIRLRLMTLMVEYGELCVCEMTHALAIPQPKASKHLAVLRAAGVVRMRRDAQWVLYAPEPEAAAALQAVIPVMLGKPREHPELAADIQRLSTMRCRPTRTHVA
jgi:ArsR family transcriptional regulator